MMRAPPLPHKMCEIFRHSHSSPSVVCYATPRIKSVSGLSASDGRGSPCPFMHTRVKHVRGEKVRSDRQRVTSMTFATICSIGGEISFSILTYTVQIASESTLRLSSNLLPAHKPTVTMSLSNTSIISAIGLIMTVIRLSQNGQDATRGFHPSVIHVHLPVPAGGTWQGSADGVTVDFSKSPSLWTRFRSSIGVNSQPQEMFLATINGDKPDWTLTVSLPDGSAFEVSCIPNRALSRVLNMQCRPGLARGDSEDDGTLKPATGGPDSLRFSKPAQCQSVLSTNEQSDAPHNEL